MAVLSMAERRALPKSAFAVQSKVKHKVRRLFSKIDAK